ncbi:hypothetical protein VTP01DRAFT_715 [Rhizomucor pusillus]|uniref:uncharacterized protein n=1 Tax=Rhizomucor pusillus TaxID=4840 RepID=UPI0037441D5E
MSNSTFSKNLFDVLGEEDDVRQPAPTKTEKKTNDKARAAEKQGSPKANGASRGGARGGRRNGRQQNGRPQRGRQFDRHSGTGLVDNEKKEKQGWGHPETAEAEAANDTTSPKDPAGAEEPVKEAAEPEEQVKTLDEYLAEKANKSLKVSLPEARKANEGTDDSKWKDAVAFTKQEEPEYFAVKESKPAKKTEKQRKEKVVIEIEQRFQEPARSGFRGRGNRGGQRGGFRGERRGNRGNNRSRNNAPAINIQDDAAFPSLGATTA